MAENDFKKLAEEIVFSYEARCGVIKEIVEDTHRMLEDFRQRREEMSKVLQEALAGSESLRKTDFNKMMGGILAIQLGREENVKQMLADFRREEEEVALRLRKLLDKGEEVRIKDFKKMIAKIKEEQGEREKTTSLGVRDQLEKMQAEVHTMLARFSQEREKMASEWKKVLATMQTFPNKKVDNPNN